MRRLLGTLQSRDPVLANLGWILIASLIVMGGIAPFDSRLVTGLNPWIKPIKFAASITVYVWTLAWLMGYVARPRWLLRTISWGIATVMLVEFVCIAFQAARGTTSHYNVSTPLDMSIWVAMSGGIMLNTLFATLLCGVFFTRQPRLPSPYLWGIRLGFLLFIPGGLVGMFMVFGNAHTVGLPDGGPGLPFLNWSIRAGDLRIAHLMGMHALQIFPLIGYVASRWPGFRSPQVKMAAVWGFALLYLLVTAWQLSRALSGQPLVYL